MASYLNRSTRFFVVPCLFFAALASAQEPEFTGKVVGAIEGDTLNLMGMVRADVRDTRNVRHY